MERRRPFCAEASAESGEPLAATASRVDHWILVEHRGFWGSEAVAASTLPGEVKRHLAREAAVLGRTKVLLIRRPQRRTRDGLRVFWGSSPERGGRLSYADLAGPDDLVGLDFTTPGEAIGHPLLLACTHGKHDRCCARYGRPVYEALADQADADWVWQCSHVGGDRFAGNVVCLPEGLYFGRVDPADTWAILDEYLAGRIHLPFYRGRACYAFAVQAAERAVREETGLRGFDELELVSKRPIVFRAGGRLYEVDVTATRGELTYLTCSADRLSRPPRYAARILRESAA